VNSSSQIRPDFIQEAIKPQNRPSVAQVHAFEATRAAILPRVDANGQKFRTTGVRAAPTERDSRVRLLAQIRGTKDAFPMRRAPRRGSYYDSSPVSAH
jgi:hypothetical protein